MNKPYFSLSSRYVSAYTGSSKEIPSNTRCFIGLYLDEKYDPVRCRLLLSPDTRNPRKTQAENTKRAHGQRCLTDENGFSVHRIHCTVLKPPDTLCLKHFQTLGSKRNVMVKYR